MIGLRDFGRFKGPLIGLRFEGLRDFDRFKGLNRFKVL